MMSVKETMRNMCGKHLAEVRETLAADKAYNRFTLSIFDAFMLETPENDIIEELSLSNNSFKVFERVIERAIFKFYGLQDTSIQDMIFSSIFYAIYSNNEKSIDEQTKELEGLFHSMKQFNMDQESSTITAKLYELNVGTQLEPVYKHLANKYQAISYKNSLALNYFTQFNQTLTEVLDSDETSNKVKELIVSYKQIRNIYESNKNITSEVVYNLCKFTCITLASQNQLLKDGNISIDELISTLKSGLEALPFSMEKFYLNNIFEHVYAQHLTMNNKDQFAKCLLRNNKEVALFESFNFDFPNSISSKIYYSDDRFETKKLKFNKNKTINYKILKNSAKSFLDGDYLFNTILN